MIEYLDRLTVGEPLSEKEYAYQLLQKRLPVLRSALLQPAT